MNTLELSRCLISGRSSARRPRRQFEVSSSFHFSRGRMWSAATSRRLGPRRLDAAFRPNDINSWVARGRDQ